MASADDTENLDHLINLLETIDVASLKKTTYNKYLNKLLSIVKQSLAADGFRFNIILEHIKSLKKACFQRDVMVDLVAKLISNDLHTILRHPFQRSNSLQWNTMACGIVAIPDLVANCDAAEKYPALRKEPYYNNLVDRLFQIIERVAGKGTHVEYKLFILKILGRIALDGYHSIVWDKFTRRAIYDTRLKVVQLCSDIIKLAIKPPEELANLELFIDCLCLPIFINLKPDQRSGQLIKRLIGTSIRDSDHLRYIVCDKSIFRTNHHLTREKQAIVLFNIASYLSSLVQPQVREIGGDDTTILSQSHSSISLLSQTLLEIVRSWTNPTKIVIRTNKHNKYISCALLVFLKHALDQDFKQLTYHASEIQSMIVNSIPIYLNRASPELRNLACCLCQLILPKLRDVVLNKQASSSASAMASTLEELKLDFKVDLDDDLLYLQRVFSQDVVVLFRDVCDDMTNEATKTNKTITTSTAMTHDIPIDSYSEISAAALAARATALCPHADHVVGDNQANFGQTTINDRQLQGKTNYLRLDDGEDDKAAIGPAVHLVDLNCASQADEVQIKNCHEDDAIYDDGDEDLVPFNISEDEDDNNEEDDDEFELGDDASRVPIYLRDCIDGLIENSNHRYVRLCLIKAASLIDEIIGQQDDDADALSRSESVCLAARREKPAASRYLDKLAITTTTATTGARPACVPGGGGVSLDVNSTIIRDAGVELARTVLFLDNQFNIEKFDEYRLNCLVSLCYAAPNLVGRYLVDELNGSNRSMRQQLDILNVLVFASHRLAFGSLPNARLEDERAEKIIVISSKKRNTRMKINRFAPHASLFFYGISHRLKADFLDMRDLIITQPESIMSAFRERHVKDDNDGETHETTMMTGKKSLTVRMSAPEIRLHQSMSCFGVKPPSRRMVLEESDDDDDKQANSKQVIKTSRSLERDSISDDSYLLSRILLSISNILSCSAQQPVTCKLSSDLLDILSAYRCHPDTGVQRAMVSCLKMIRDCTPSTYYSGYIEKRMLRSFGSWLTKNESNIQR